ncbi:ABC transporter substrate-binding protein [Polymorphobacter multimanifer]|uniref:Multiple sugar transport system substrate-binding protein n=1 Tax=Polymorphobacter multimanifer TaxID=1070431 RepID=A0A841L4J2_9SPHN|nr:extracellular solute-binding protein [Polymorphobacter multimanifer]MBB6227769.1 multiple sugar transport system substrate-binding protein [Polymorphobacter multimanifer]GGI76892.1 ABC transporter substrate-binding protein [Polymorphobacter multimanifer]
MLLLLAGCAAPDQRPEIVVQRFFGECGVIHGGSTDVAAADTECGILTTLFNRFEAENPDIRLKVNVVAWPGYPQLAAQIAAGDPPDLVTMHQSVISDYQDRGLLEPMDGVLVEAGVDAATFTPAARAGVVKYGRVYAMPWDTIGRLFHINTRLMAQAGLMRDGKPVLPRSPDELLAQARQFKAATGKPYLVQAHVNAPDFHVALLYTYLLAQGDTIFPDARHVRLDTPAARQVVALFRQLHAEGLTTRNQDFPAATARFVQGGGGIFPVGTWMIGPYDAEAARPGSALYRSYAIAPFPRLWGQDAAFVDGHAWVMPRAARSRSERAAIARFLGFLARYNADWSRTGQLPAFQPVLETDSFRALPHRGDIVAIASTGTQLPEHVRRQSAIQGLIGEELEAAVTGIKPIDRALADAERRVNRLYAELP